MVLAQQRLHERLHERDDESMRQPPGLPTARRRSSTPPRRSRSETSSVDSESESNTELQPVLENEPESNTELQPILEEEEEPGPDLSVRDGDASSGLVDAVQAEKLAVQAEKLAPKVWSRQQSMAVAIPARSVRSLSGKLSFRSSKRPEEVAKGSIREYGWLKRLQLDRVMLEKFRAEIDVIEQVMLRSNEVAVAHLFCKLKADGVDAESYTTAGGSGCFESPLLVSYFEHKLEMIEEGAGSGEDWFHELCTAYERGLPLKSVLKKHEDYVDETLRLSANSMVWLARASPALLHAQ